MPPTQKSKKNTGGSTCYLKDFLKRKFLNVEENIYTRIQQKSYSKENADITEKFFENYIKKMVNYNSFGGETLLGTYYRSTDKIKHKQDYQDIDLIEERLIFEVIKFLYLDLIKTKEQELCILTNSLLYNTSINTNDGFDLNLKNKNFVIEIFKFEKYLTGIICEFMKNPSNLEYDNLKNDLNLFFNDWIQVHDYLKDNFSKPKLLYDYLILYCIQYLINFKSNFNHLHALSAITLCKYHNGTDSKNLTDFFNTMVCLKNELNVFFFASQINEKILSFLDVLEATFDSESQKTFFLASSENYSWFNPHSLGLFKFYHNLKLTKKNDGDLYYHEFNLPKITFINFNGYRNDFEKSLLGIFPKVQYISIRFESLLEGDILCSNSSNNNFEINVNSEKFKLSSLDIFALFEVLIFKIISKFEPFLIIMSHSFIFNKNIIENIHLKPSIFRKIIEKLGFISNNRLILCPNLYIQKEKKMNSFLKTLENFNSAFEFERNASRFSFEERTLKNFKQYLHEMFGCMFLKTNLKNFEGKTLKSLQKLNGEFQKTLISSVYEFCKRFPHFSYLLPKMVHLQTLQRLKSKVLSKVEEKNVIIEASKINEENQSLMTNKFEIIILDKKNRVLTPIIQEIILKEENGNFFYYDLKSTVYYVCYDVEKIYFFNVNKAGRIQHFYLDFSEKNNKVRQIPHYNDDYNKKLVDFSMVYDSLTAIYLIWGRYVSNDLFKYRLCNVDSDLNYGIYKLDIKKHVWFYYEIKDFFCPRIKTSAVLFDVQDINEKLIFVFGGLKYNEFFEKDEILNIVDKITINQKGCCHEILNKKKYRNEYLPLYNSIVIDVGYDSREEIYEMLMLGGDYDQNIFNRKPNKVMFFEIKYNVSSGACSFESNEIINSENEELEYPYPSASRNYFFHKEQKRLFLISILFNSVNRKKNDNENTIGSRFSAQLKLKSELSNLKTHDFLEIRGIINDLTFSKGAALHNITKNYGNNYVMNDYNLLFPKIFEETAPTIYLFFKKNNNNLYYFEKDQNDKLDSKIMINSIKFLINMNNVDKLIYDHQNSQININTCMYSNKSRELFIYIDDFEKRLIFKLSFFNLKSKMIEANIFFKETLKLSTKCSIFLEENNLYLLGGKTNSNGSKTNLKMNILKKEIFYFPSNLRKMSYPYVVLYEHYLFLVEKKIVYNFEIKEKEEKQYLYIEYIDVNELKIWKVININLNVISDKYDLPQENIKYEGKIKDWIQKNSFEYIFYIKGITYCSKMKEFFKINFEKLTKYITKINQETNSVNLNYKDESLMEILSKIKIRVIFKYIFKMRMKEKEQIDTISLDRKGNIQDLSLIF